MLFQAALSNRHLRSGYRPSDATNFDLPMFVALPTRFRPGLHWATPVLLTTLAGVFVWAGNRPGAGRDALLLNWGALAGGLQSPLAWQHMLRDGSALRLFTALFLHADWAHLSGNLAFLLIFGLPAERAMGPWRFGLLFLLGGAVSNLVAVLVAGNAERSIIGASGAVSAVIGAYLALFPRAKLGVVLPLGLFLEFVRAPASLLIGIWVLLQIGFAYIGPAFGEIAWSAHIGGFVFGALFALAARGAVARRLRSRRGG